MYHCHNLLLNITAELGWQDWQYSCFYGSVLSGKLLNWPVLVKADGFRVLAEVI